MTINETSFFCNRQKNVAMKTNTEDKSPPQLNEAFISLDTISYGKQYALDIYDPDNNDTVTYPRATGLSVTKFERNYTQKLKYEFIKSYPLSITSMPVSYNGSDLLRCSVGMTYIRYTVDRITGAQGPAPKRTGSDGQSEVEFFNSSGIVLENQYNEDERRDMGLIP